MTQASYDITGIKFSKNRAILRHGACSVNEGPALMFQPKG